MFFLGGFIPLILVKHFKKNKENLKHWKKTKANVYDISYDTLVDSVAFYPKYKYSHEGREYSGTSSIGVRVNKYKVGDVIEIRFNPSNPAESDAPHYSEIGPMTLSAFDIGIIVFSAMSVLCFAVGFMSVILFLFRKDI